MGHVDSTYWLDLGTPAAFVQGSADLVRGLAPTGALPQRPADTLVLTGATVADDAVISGGSALGRDVPRRRRCDRRPLDRLRPAQIGEGASVRNSVIGHGATVGAGSVVADAVIGDGADIGAGCELLAGVRVWPGVIIPGRWNPVLRAELSLLRRARWARFVARRC